MRFLMPYGEDLEIRPSKEMRLDELLDIAIDEEIDDLFYTIYWGDKLLPWSFKTKATAYALAMGCQWGAQEMVKKI